MQTVTFGKTGIEITRMGFGSWAIGGTPGARRMTMRRSEP